MQLQSRINVDERSLNSICRSLSRVAAIKETSVLDKTLTNDREKQMKKISAGLVSNAFDSDITKAAISTMRLTRHKKPKK